MPLPRSSDGPGLLIRTVAETGSTNDDLALLARDGAPEGSWLRAERQTAGRGRQGRAWEPVEGNLYASTLVRLAPADPPPATLSLVAAVALQEVVEAYAPDALVRIKWPNDLLADSAKLSGILLERAGDAVIVGFGVNLAGHPRGLDRPATSIAGLTGRVPEPVQFLDHLASGFSTWLGRWRADGLAPIRSAWLRKAHTVGTALSVVLPDGAPVEGLFDGLDEQGALRLRLADGSCRIVQAGDVFLL